MSKRKATKKVKKDILSDSVHSAQEEETFNIEYTWMEPAKVDIETLTPYSPYQVDINKPIALNSNTKKVNSPNIINKECKFVFKPGILFGIPIKYEN